MVLVGLNLFKRAIKATYREMIVSLLLLGVWTVVLALIMWFAEVKVNDGYRFIDALVWTIVKYVSDPAEIVSPPVTIYGQVAGTLVGVLGIAIFAVPAGLIGSGLITAMSELKEDDKTQKNSQRLHKRFRRIPQTSSFFETDKGRKKNWNYVPQYRALESIRAKTEMTEDEITAAVNNCPDMRIMNFADTQRSADSPVDRLVVVNYPLNNEYGCFLDRQSDVTIVAPVSCSELGTGNFAYTLAAFGGFNYVSREIEADIDSPFGFYTMLKSKFDFIDTEDNKRKTEVHAMHFIDDLVSLKVRSKDNGRRHWFIFIMASKKSLKYQLHLWRLATDKSKEMFRVIGMNGEEYGSTILSDDDQTYKNMCSSISESLEEFSILIKGNEKKVEVTVDNNDLLKSVGASNIMCRVGGGLNCNALTVRIGYELLTNQETHLKIVERLAREIKSQIEPMREIPEGARKFCLSRGEGFLDANGANVETVPAKLKAMIKKQEKKIRKKYKDRRLWPDENQPV